MLVARESHLYQNGLRADRIQYADGPEVESFHHRQSVPELVVPSNPRGGIDSDPELVGRDRGHCLHLRAVHHDQGAPPAPRAAGRDRIPAHHSKSVAKGGRECCWMTCRIN